MQRQGRRQVTGLHAEALRQACPNPGMPPGLASSRDALIQDVVIQGMAKAKACSDRPIRPFGTASRLEELPVVRQRRALGLNLVLGTLKARRDRRRRKLDTGHTRGFEQGLFLATTVRELLLEQRPERCWDDRGEGLHPAPHGPPCWSLTHHLVTDEFVHDGDHEQGIPMGALMQHGGQVCCQPGGPKALMEIGCDLNVRQIVQCQLHTLAMLLKLGEDGP